jgi:hypothetical protein
MAREAALVTSITTNSISHFALGNSEPKERRKRKVSIEERQ